MKILTRKKQNEILENTRAIMEAIASADHMRILNSIENVANITYEIGGLKALREEKQVLEKMK